MVAPSSHHEKTTNNFPGSSLPLLPSTKHRTMSKIQLAVHQDDADILLKTRNVLSDPILDKYRLAGQITQTGLTYITSLINDSYHLGKTGKLITVQELCILTDSFVAKLLTRGYNSVKEKGISSPTSVEVNELVAGFSPEVDDDGEYVFSAGDVVTVSLGVQVDGYTANVSKTIVIYPAGNAPAGPLVGAKADAVCATHIATEAMVGLLGLSLSPEKLPGHLAGSSVSGSVIRSMVDGIADSFNCVVVPGSKIRRVRRFLAGQAEGIVAERDFKGVVWDESHQEERLLRKGTGTHLIVSEKSEYKSASNATAVPTDEFIVVPGEVYQIDIRMVSLADINEAGLVTLEEVDQFTGKNNKQEFNSKPTIHIRDFAMNHQLKLRSARKLLGEVDRKFSVYPFKLAYTSKHFPINVDDSQTIPQQIDDLKKDVGANKLGLSEMSNRHLVKSKPIQITKFIPLEKILLSANPTGKHGVDANKPVLPGMELPLPQLGVSSLKLKALLKSGQNIANVRESTTVVISNLGNEVIRLTGGSAPSWVSSKFELTGELKETIEQVVKLSRDERFGVKVKVVKGLKVEGEKVEEMELA